MTARAKPIPISEAVAYIEKYQRWRRGEILGPQPSPAHVGACLDVVVAAAKETMQRKGRK